jgi:dolichol-phosphate mannosyltransferase
VPFMARLSIIIPTLDEAHSIQALLEGVVANATNVVGQEFEIIVVDDDSIDGTREQVRKWSTDPRIKLIHRCQEKGLASAIRSGATEAQGEVLLVMDADLSHSPEFIPDLVSPVISGDQNIVIGSRYIKDGSTPGWSPWRKIASRLASLPARILTDIKDPLSGFFAVRKPILLSLSQDVPGFKIALALLVRGGDSLRCQEVPIAFFDRKEDRSKLSRQVFFSYLHQIVGLAGGNPPQKTCLRFGVVGLIGFLIDFLVFYSLSNAGVGLGTANALSFGAALLFTFLGNGKWTFADSNVDWQPIWKKGALFLSVAFLALVLRGGVLAFLTQICHFPNTHAVTLAIAVAAGVNYLGSSFLVFSSPVHDVPQETRWRVLAVGVIGYTVLLRLFYMGPLELMHQEAYYWNYGQHMDFGYLDHPPMLGRLIRTSTEFSGGNEWAVRLVAFCCWLMTALFSYLTARQAFNRSTAMGVVLLVAILPAYYCTGFLSTPDAPLMACWAGTLYYLHKALFQRQPWAWYGADVTMGIGMLSKYTIILLVPSLFIYMLNNRNTRKWFARPEPYLAAIIALVLFSPVILWNADHHWASFVFQGPRRFTDAFDFSLDAFLGHVLLLLTPIGVLAIASTIETKGLMPIHPRTGGTNAETYSFALFCSIIPFFFFFAFSLIRDVKMNWTAPVWLVLLPFMAQSMIPKPAVRTDRLSSIVRRMWPAAILVTTIAYGAILYYFVLGLPGLPYFGDQPFLIGWAQMADHLETYKNEIDPNGAAPIVVGLDKYKIASGLSFYRKKTLIGRQGTGADEAASETAGRNLFGGNGLMYEFWYPPKRFIGRSIILVSDRLEDLTRPAITDRFNHLNVIKRVTIRKNGKDVKTYFFRLGQDYHPPSKA